MIVVEVADFFFLCFFFLEFVVRGNIPKESFVIAMNRPNGQAMASRICFKISMRATRILGVFTRHNILAQSIQYTENSTVCCTYVFPSRAFRK